MSAVAPTRIVADPTEAMWRRDWEKHWAYARRAGWTVVMSGVDAAGNPTGESIIALRDGADCTRLMGRGIRYDYRLALSRLQEIGTLRGWLVDGAA